MHWDRGRNGRGDRGARIASLAAALGGALVAVAGRAAAHDWGTRTEADRVIEGRVNVSGPPVASGGRVAGAGAADAGLLPGVSGPAEWALFALVGLLVTVVAFGLLVVLAKRTYGLLTGTAGWLGRVAAVLPLSAGQVRVAVVAMLAFSAAAFVGVQAQANTTSLWDAEEGPAGRANDFKDHGLKENPVGSLEADAILTGDSYSGAPYDRPSPDTDGDRLKDAWEERGRTPGGARLPGADPNHKDLYVQVNYGADADLYTAAEKRALVESWARMPVDNPDGEEGIDLHLVEGDRLETTPTFDSMQSDRVDRFYTREYLGPRRCVYHQIVVGQVGMGNVVGVGSVPGYVSVVEADRAEFNGSDTTRRVHVTNHELLHNTVGTLPSGGTHTAQGWLKPAPTADDDFLSPSAAAVLDERIEGSGYYQHQICANETATASG
ncbi:MAG: hypothetical protein ABEJ05_03380 [Haloglomus sp.]